MRPEHRHFQWSFRALAVFVVLYILLMLPWPGWQGAYTVYFKRMVSSVLTMQSYERQLSFDLSAESDGRLRIVILNPKLLAADGSGPVRNVDFNVMHLGWQPVALLMALVMATPAAVMRKLSRLAWGLALVHVFVFGALQFSLWNESSEVGLVSLPQWLKTFTNAAQDAALQHLSLTLPVVLWAFLITPRPSRKMSPNSSEQ